MFGLPFLSSLPFELQQVFKRLMFELQGWMLMEHTGDGAHRQDVGAPVIPVGAILSIGRVPVPVGFLETNGQAVGRRDYPSLFTAIGTEFGAGNDSTTFNVPTFAPAVGVGVIYSGLRIVQ